MAVFCPHGLWPGEDLVVEDDGTLGGVDFFEPGKKAVESGGNSGGMRCGWVFVDEFAEAGEVGEAWLGGHQGACQ